MKRSDIINLQELWFHTDKGRIVFERELGRIPNKCINSPLRKDQNPSFSLFQDSNGFWRWKDFSNGESGNVIDFIMKRYNKSYPEALKYINEGIAQNPIEITKNSVKKEKKELLIEFSEKPYTKEHIAYWSKYLLPVDYLISKNVYAIDKWAINGKIQKIPKGAFAFCYYVPEIDKCKVLTLNTSKQDKWRNNIPNDYLLNFPENHCETIWVNKSYKDCLVMEYHFGFCSCATQNEDGKILEKNIPRLQAISNEIVINFGADKMAVDNCTYIQQKYKTKYWNTPKYMLKYGVVDVSDCIAEFGVEIVKKQLIKKKFL